MNNKFIGGILLIIASAIMTIWDTDIPVSVRTSLLAVGIALIAVSKKHTN